MNYFFMIYKNNILYNSQRLYVVIILFIYCQKTILCLSIETDVMKRKNC